MADVKNLVHGDMEMEPISLESTISGKAPDVVVQHANDADEAMKAFAGRDGEILVLDEATNRRLLRKIDRHLMPVSIDEIGSIVLIR